MASPRRKTRNYAAESAPHAEIKEPVVLPLPVSPQPEAQPAQKQFERLGDILRRAREHRGDNLHQIAEYLCIRPGFLIALEGSRYEEFPADAYVVGFLRSYAEYLGLDGKEAIDYYRHEMAGRRKKPVLAMPTPISEGRAPSAIIMVAAILAALLIYALWYGLSSSDRTAVSKPEPPSLATAGAPPSAQVTPPALQPLAPATPVVPAMQDIAPAPQQPAYVTLPPATPPAAKPEAPKTEATAPAQPVVKPASRVTIKAVKPSWVLVNDSRGRTVFDRVLKAGETYLVPAGEGLKMTTGNATGIRIDVDGSEMPQLQSDSSHVTRNVPLDPDALAAFAQAPGNDQ